MKYNKEIRAKFTADQLAEIKAEAEKQGMPISTFIRVAALQAARE